MEFLLHRTPLKAAVALASPAPVLSPGSTPCTPPAFRTLQPLLSPAAPRTGAAWCRCCCCCGSELRCCCLSLCLSCLCCQRACPDAPRCPRSHSALHVSSSPPPYSSSPYCRLPLPLSHSEMCRPDDSKEIQSRRRRRRHTWLHPPLFFLSFFPLLLLLLLSVSLGSLHPAADATRAAREGPLLPNNSHPTSSLPPGRRRLLFSSSEQ